MKKLLLALALLCAPTSVWAQCTGIFPANTFCGNSTGSAAPPVSTAVSPLVLGQIAAGTLIGNPSAALASAVAFTIQGQVNLATPNTTQDFLPIWDHVTGTIKNVTPSALTGGIGNTPHTQDFIAGTNFTAGSTTTLTISSTPATTDSVSIYFDGVAQSGPSGTAATWSISGAIITFNAAIPTNTQVVEVKWSTSITLAGVATVNSQSGSISLLPGATTAITTVGNNITFGNDVGTVSITDAAYGAKCNGVFASGQNGLPTSLTISSGSPNLTSTGSTFTSADVGKSIWVPGAGVAGAGLSTTILTFTDTTHVVLAANASTTVTAFATTNAAPLVYGTDDTVAIQAAMTATPNGGKLIIPAGAAIGGQQSGGCLIKRQGSNAYVLTQDHPFSIQGNGHFSNLMTDPSIPSTVTDLFIPVGSYDWANITWENFSIGDSPSFLPSTLLMYTRHGGQGLSFVDTNGGNAFTGITIRNMSIGESGNDYSLVIGNPGTSNSQFTIIEHNKIWGGVQLLNTSDSFRIVHNILQGKSNLGGVMSFVAGAGKFEFSGNNVTWAGGLRIDGGNKPAVINNFFEELYATSEANNAMVDFNGAGQTVTMPTFTGNIVNAITGTTSTPVRFANAAAPNFGDNYITTSTARTGVTSVSTLSCIAPNSWNGVGTHFSTALANSYAGC